MWNGRWDVSACVAPPVAGVEVWDVLNHPALFACLLQSCQGPIPRVLQAPSDWPVVWFLAECLCRLAPPPTPRLVKGSDKTAKCCKQGSYIPNS